mgnify:CR=1 FL=1
MGRKGGVIAAAVFHMDDEGNVQKVCFQRCIRTVRPENMQDILCGGEVGTWLMHIQAVTVMIMIVSLITIYGQKRKQTDEFQALPQYI